MAKLSVTLTQCYHQYLLKYHPNHIFYVPEIVLFRDILEEYNELRVKLMIEQAYMCQARHGLGEFFISRKKAKKINHMDYQYFKETGKVRMHYNMHSNGFYSRFYWEKNKRKNVVKYKHLYTFKPTRTHARTLAASIKTNGINIYKSNS